MTPEQRAREFVTVGFRDLGVPSLEPYIEIIAELIRGAEDDERRRIADVIDEGATQAEAKPDADPDRIDVMRGIAGALRTPREELITVALMAMCDEIRAEQADAKHKM